jgi:hypothetical protein
MACRTTPDALEWRRDWGGIAMTLERGRIIGYDNNRLAFEFTMKDAEGKTVHCMISSTAMDQLAGGKGTIPSGREAQFLRFRDEIERIASSLFDKGVSGPIGFVRIFHHHIG